jgi:hypothetical protein
MLHPDGSSIEMSLDWLQHTPFQDYLIPGIILFIANGLFSIFVFISSSGYDGGYSISTPPGRE